MGLCALLIDTAVERSTFRLAASVSGTPASVVLLHAGVADRRSWFGVMGALAPEHSSVAYDRPGFGETPAAGASGTELEHLDAVVETLAATPLVLVGNSQGGRIAIDFALRSPDLVRALVLVAPAIGGAPEPALDGQVAALARAIDAADDAGDLDEVNRLEALAWLDGPAGPEGRVAPNVRTLFLAMNRIALASGEPATVGEPTSAHERLEELRVPTRVIVGTLDLPHVRARARELAARAPGAELTLMDGVAHLPQLERPGDVAGLIRAAGAAA